MAEKMQGREVIFECRPVGNLMRVMDMDTATMTEVLTQGPAAAGICAAQGGSYFLNIVILYQELLA